MMTSALVSHDRGVSLVTFAKPRLNRINETVPLALPSRFPKSSLPFTAVSLTGFIYIYAENGTHIWEYDPRGQRISEIAFPNARIRRVFALGSEVVVALDVRVRVMQKQGGRWVEINTLDVSGSPQWRKSTKSNCLRGPTGI